MLPILLFQMQLYFYPKKIVILLGYSKRCRDFRWRKCCWYNFVVTLIRVIIIIVSSRVNNRSAGDSADSWMPITHRDFTLHDSQGPLDCVLWSDMQRLYSKEGHLSLQNPDTGLYKGPHKELVEVWPPWPRTEAGHCRRNRLHPKWIKGCKESVVTSPIHIFIWFFIYLFINNSVLLQLFQYKINSK